MKTLIKLLSALIVTGVVTSCSNRPKEKLIEENTSVPSFEVWPLKKDTFRYDLKLPGELKAYDEVTLYAKLDGFVKELRVDRGDIVKKGQILAYIEAPEIEQQYLATKSKQREIEERLAFSSSNYKYLETAASMEGAVSKIELEAAQAEFIADSASLNAAKAEVAAANQLKEYLIIRAPFDAVVNSRIVSPGALVGSGRQPLYILSRQNKLRLEVAVPSKHRGALHQNSKVDFGIDSYPGKRFPVSFSRSSKALDADSRSTMVEFDVDNSEGLLSAGDYANVHLNLQRDRPTFWVPVRAIMNTKENKYVATVLNEVVKLIPVKTGLLFENKVEVFGDFDEGDEIILHVESSLRSGLKIVPIRKEGHADGPISKR